MLPTIEKSAVFQSELKAWRDRISKIENEDHQRIINQLINDLLKEVRYIDKQHQTIGGAFNIPSTLNESRDKISNIRKTISKKIEESTK